MKTIVTGIAVFIAWSIFSNYWYVCKIKHLCNNGQAVVTVDEKNVENDLNQENETFSTNEKQKDSLKAVIEKSVIYFAYDTSRVVNNPALRKVTQTAQVLDPDSILIKGHTCNLGTKAYNYNLGIRRAQEVKDALADQNAVNSSQIAIVSYGEKRPVEPNINEENREDNRRVRIDIKD